MCRYRSHVISQLQARAIGNGNRRRGKRGDETDIVHAGNKSCSSDPPASIGDSKMVEEFITASVVLGARGQGGEGFTIQYRPIPVLVGVGRAAPRPLLLRRGAAGAAKEPVGGGAGGGAVFTIGIAEVDRPRRCRAHHEKAKSPFNSTSGRRCGSAHRTRVRWSGYLR